MEVEVHALLTSAQEVGELSASRPNSLFKMEAKFLLLYLESSWFTSTVNEGGNYEFSAQHNENSQRKLSYNKMYTL
jgi:hypothetical protein